MTNYILFALGSVAIGIVMLSCGSTVATWQWWSVVALYCISYALGCARKDDI
jgi:hypothetical protein